MSAAIISSSNSMFMDSFTPSFVLQWLLPPENSAMSSLIAPITKPTPNTIRNS